MMRPIAKHGVAWSVCVVSLANTSAEFGLVIHVHRSKEGTVY